MSLATRSMAEERMDTDCVDYDDYRHCLRDLARVNTVTLTSRPTLAWLARELAGRNSFSLLDVACGHGDILRRISRWAERKGVAARLEGVDLNPWSTRAAREATPASSRIAYHTGDVFTFQPEGDRFDFIISSQFTHHLTDDEVVTFIRWMEANARRGWFIGDLHRHWFPYYGFGVLAWLARWHPFVLSDGRISIARSFVPDDWRRLIQNTGLTAADVEISWHMPFRLCVARRCPDR
jgi:2-polyprenyl-3-methyl-5-hydroxy-6-metoxy-1,4-benzoquinol methylase